MRQTWPKASSKSTSDIGRCCSLYSCWCSLQISVSLSTDFTSSYMGGSEPAVKKSQYSSGRDEPRAVLVVDEAIREDTLALVCPEVGEGVAACGAPFVSHEHTLDDLRYLAQVEGVVWLRRHRSEHVARPFIFEKGLRDGSENALNNLVGHGREVEQVHVPNHAVCHQLPSAAGGAHCRDKRHIDDRLPAEGLAIIPAATESGRTGRRVGGSIDHLAHQLNGRLRAVRLALGHVEVVDKDEEALAQHRAPHCVG
eukprot:scaffold43252_cov28-Tisochrysis_lutea.AAC.5